MKTYKGHITKLEPNEIFVMGTNSQGWHGAGSAGFASFGKPGNLWRGEGYASQPDGWQGYWNIKGQAKGLQQGTHGKSWGIVTVTRPGALKSISCEQMQQQIRKLYKYAVDNPDITFYVAQEDRIGFNGWEPEVMARAYKCLPIPNNISFEEGFAKRIIDTPVYYAGIGSRDTPSDISSLMSSLATILEKQGFVLRSGNATGADQAFASGVAKNADIYLPWPKFELEFRESHPNHKYHVVWDDDEKAEKSIDKFHPKADNLKCGGRAMMRRNYRQIIGRNEPNSEFVICWTPNGEKVGGTSQAIRIAESENIIVCNLGNERMKDFFTKLIKQYK